jgi:hypothetical protein
MEHKHKHRQQVLFQGSLMFNWVIAKEKGVVHRLIAAGSCFNRAKEN